jgi:transposase
LWEKKKCGERNKADASMGNKPAADVGPRSPSSLETEQFIGPQSPRYDAGCQVMSHFDIFSSQTYTIMGAINHIYVGIDVSKEELVTAYRDCGKWQKGKLPNDSAAIADWLWTVGAPGKHFVLEATGPYSERLVHELGRIGAVFSLVNPQQSRAMSRVLLKTNKTDDQDAQTLSLLGEKLDIKTFAMPDPMHKKRKEAFSAIASLQKQEQQLRNQLHAFGYRVEPNPVAVKALQEVLAAVQHGIAELEKELTPDQDAEDARRCVERISSIRGVGKATAEVFVALFGDLRDFGSAKQLAKFVGLAPREFSSGKSVRARACITKKGNSKLRALLFNCARSAMRYNQKCKELYDRLIAKGKNGKVALTAVMHKLLRQIFGVARSGMNFDSNFQKPIQKVV